MTLSDILKLLGYVPVISGWLKMKRDIQEIKKLLEALHKETTKEPEGIKCDGCGRNTLKFSHTRVAEVRGYKTTWGRWMCACGFYSENTMPHS